MSSGDLRLGLSFTVQPSASLRKKDCSVHVKMIGPRLIFYAAIPGMKQPFVKYCKAYDARLQSLVTSPRVIPVVEDEPTDISMLDF